MTCQSYGSTTGVSLYYVRETDVKAALPETLSWNEVPMTSETLTATLSTATSNRISSQRGYADSSVTGGEVSGPIGYEVAAGPFMDDMLTAALQSSGSLSADGDFVINSDEMPCFAFMKRVKVTGGYEYFIYRGVAVNSLSIQISLNALLTGEISLMGIRLGAGVYNATDDSNKPQASIPAGWTLNPVAESPLMTSGFAVRNLDVRDSLDNPVSVVARDITLTINNNLRQQNAVGTGTPFGSGIGNSRIMVEMSMEAYYEDASLFNALFDNEQLSMGFDLIDSDGNGYQFQHSKVRPTEAPGPSAEGTDTDLVQSTTFQAFEHPTDGSVKITRVVA